MTDLAQNEKIKISFAINGYFTESGAHLTPQLLGGKRILWMCKYVSSEAVRASSGSEI